MGLKPPLGLGLLQFLINYHLEYYWASLNNPPLEEFVAFMGAYEIESMFKEFENLYDAVYRPGKFSVLKYCYANYEFNSDIDAFIDKVSAVQEENNILQESMEEEIDETVSSLDEKDEDESEEQKEEERIDHPCPPSNESNSSTHTLFNSP